MGVELTPGRSASSRLKTRKERARLRRIVRGAGTGARPSVVAVSGDQKAAVHDTGVRVADEAVAPLLQAQHEALRSDEFHAREYAVETGSAQVEVVNIRAVADDKAVRRSGLQLRHVLAAHRQRDRETGPDCALDCLR